VVTSVTVSTLMGAQHLAMLDANKLAETAAEATAAMTQPVLLSASPSPTSTLEDTARATPEIKIVQAAPNIVILRQAGSVTARPVTTWSEASAQVSSPGQVLPSPVPVVLPQPIVVEQPVPQRSRSSR